MQYLVFRLHASRFLYMFLFWQGESKEDLERGALEVLQKNYETILDAQKCKYATIQTRRLCIEDPKQKLMTPHLGSLNPQYDFLTVCHHGLGLGIFQRSKSG